MTLNCRLARPEDAAALHRMNAAFNDDPGVTADEVRRSLQSAREIVVLAEANGSPAGFCCTQVHRSFCYPAPVAELTEMYVSADFRRRGCASAMLRFLEAFLIAEYGVDEIHLLTGCRNDAAQAAYQKAGFAIHPEVYMTKEL